jgi:alpha-glucosidase
VQISTDSKLPTPCGWATRRCWKGSVIDLEIAGRGRLSDDLAVAAVKRNGVRSEIISPVPEKRRVVPDRYNEAEIRFRQPYRLVFRVYDDGVAYRLLTGFPDSITVLSETARFGFARNARTWYPAVQPKTGVDSFHTSFEEHYTVKPLDSIAPTALMFTPVLLSAGQAAKVLVTESDLEDYPGMFLRGTGGRALQGRFAPYPLEEKLVPGEFPQYVVARRAGYLARTKGTRAFPWRVLVIAERDTDLPANDLVYRLGAPSRLADASWIEPGRGTDEWIIGVNLYNVPFAAGVNTATYKYYVDFAKRFGLQRIMLDAGWSDNNDLFKINPDLNMDELAAYAKSQGIRLCLWTLAATLDHQLEPALDQFNRWGVDFIMTDFIDRDDQKAVNFHHRIAEACAATSSCSCSTVRSSPPASTAPGPTPSRGKPCSARSTTSGVTGPRRRTTWRWPTSAWWPARWTTNPASSRTRPKRRSGPLKATRCRWARGAGNWPCSWCTTARCSSFRATPPRASPSRPSWNCSAAFPPCGTRRGFPTAG